ncbi:MAG: efflux RND transporter periplasmic adaptor subunit [Chlamydiales bacterium]|nr:efflux RND transporter periplasmic adaptor subunit [Chlamydiia bacterium]MCP5507694.1 efflux RND transporter periplasmic adaptor subunit [Chlamydiales bacterium]
MNYKTFLAASIAVLLACQVYGQDNSDEYDDNYLDSTSAEFTDNYANNNNSFQVVIDPKQRTSLSAELRSPVIKINKRMGDDFHTNDVLIQLDDTVHQANLKKAQAIVEKAKTDLEAKQQLFKDNVASSSELKEAEANVAIAEAELIKSQRDLDATVIKAPYDGKVVQVFVEEYELPDQGEQMIEIVNDKTLLAKLLIPSSMLKNIKIGEPFKIDLNETDKEITAKVSRIGSIIDPSSATVRIEAEIDNKNGDLKAGMSGIAHFKPDEKKPIPAKTEEPLQNTTEKQPEENGSLFPFFSSPNNSTDKTQK